MEDAKIVLNKIWEILSFFLLWIWKILCFIFKWIWMGLVFVCKWIWDYFILYLKTPKTVSGILDRRFVSTRILESKEKGCGCVVFIVFLVIVLISILLGGGKDKNEKDDLSDTVMVEKKTAKKQQNVCRNNDIEIIKDTMILIDTTIDLINADTIKRDSLLVKSIDTDSVF